jgi:hypothetical protein
VPPVTRIRPERANKLSIAQPYWKYSFIWDRESPSINSLMGR